MTVLPLCGQTDLRSEHVRKSDTGLMRLSKRKILFQPNQDSMPPGETLCDIVEIDAPEGDMLQETRARRTGSGCSPRHQLSGGWVGDDRLIGDRYGRVDMGEEIRLARILGTVRDVNHSLDTGHE